MRSFRSLRAALLILLLIAFFLRAALHFFRFEELGEDRDAYLGIAENLWNHFCYCNPGTDQPTAFRPPLFILIVAFVRGTSGLVGLGLFQCLAGTLTAWATFVCGKHLINERGAFFAASLVAIDPLLLRYTSLPMTETTFTMLLALGGWFWLKSSQSRRAVAFCGLFFGLAALCRPSIWPMLPVLFVLGCWIPCFGKGTSSDATPPLRFPRTLFFETLAISLIAFVVALPWGLRNYWVMGQFKLTTTHGGYTLLLGNNATFYQAVLHQPWGTTWGDYPKDHPLSQQRWYQNLQQQLDKVGADSEFSRDRAQYRLALQQIQRSPSDFFRSILLREARLWSPIPQGPNADNYPPPLLTALWLFYLTLYLFALIGLIRVLRVRRHWPQWLWFVAVMITICTVHAFFWSNARMRAPMIPPLALLAARAITNRGERHEREASSEDETATLPMEPLR